MSLQSSRRQSKLDELEFLEQADVVTSKIINVESSLKPDPEMTMELVGEEAEDKATICLWIAKSYGEANRSYHEAYSKEVFRQIKQQLDIAAAAANSAAGNGADPEANKKRSWC